MADSTPSKYFDVLIIGGGAAGLYTALTLPPSLRVGLITKDSLNQSASDWAQGGIAAAMRPDDSPELHAEDTFHAGVGLCDPAAVEFLVHHAAKQIEHLLTLGIGFDRHLHDLAFTLEAAHSRPRVLHAADTTGKALIKTLTTHVLHRDNIEIISETFTLDLWINPNTQRCQGLLALSQGTLSWFFSAAIVLATGGGGQVFAHTTNPALSTGDGVAMAWRLGAQLRDLEFFQFHPTALAVPGAPRFLISEAVRGEGAHLLDDQGQRFMFDYHPLGELAPRDVVSRSIFNHLKQQRAQAQGPQSEHVWLDLRPIPRPQIERRFPKIIQVCQSWGVDLFQEPIPVAPAAHYWMGGVVTNLHAQTTIPGLYAVGEAASTGVHGANRLASNSLLECLVYAAALAEVVPLDIQNVEPFNFNGMVSPPPLMQAPEKTDPSQLKNFLQTVVTELPTLVWNSAGICREHTTMMLGLEQVDGWRKQLATLTLHYGIAIAPSPTHQSMPVPSDYDLRAWGETKNLLEIAYLLLRSALFRTESRGGHYRSDFPNTLEEWQAHTLVQCEEWQLSEKSASSNPA
jgi:L-aspartate oxidase